MILPRTLSVLAGVALLALGAPAAAAPQRPPRVGPLETVAAFDFGRGETAESVAVAPDGTLFVSFAFGSAIWVREPGGAATTVPVPTGGGVVGAVALDRRGMLWFGASSPDPAAAGVWSLRRGPAGWAVRREATLPPAAAPNGVAFDHRGALYVADSVHGAVYRLAPGAAAAAVWLRDPLLDPDPAKSAEGIPFPGANGVKVFRGALYVANSARATVLRVALRPDGAPGRPEVRYPGVVADDFAFDVAGNLYVTTDPFQTVERVAPDGTRVTLATAADGLDGPSSAAFGAGTERCVLYVTNLGLFGTAHRPSLQRLSVGVPGDRLP